MCGIAFWSKARKASRIADARQLATALLRQIESRGGNASGAAWHDPDGITMWQKDAVKGSILAKQLAVQPASRQGILHTRFATKGSAAINGNNHPIVRPGIVLVHNGVIWNDDALFASLKADRQHQVDTEAIAASLMTDGPLDDRLTRPQGSAAIIWMDVTDQETGNDPVIHAARLSSSPLVVGQTAAGDTVGASTQAMLVAAGQACGLTFTWIHALDEWSYVRIRQGRIEEMRDIPEPAWSKYQTRVTPNWSTSGLGNKYAYPTRSSYTRDERTFDDAWDTEDEDNLRKWLEQADRRDGKLS